MQPRSDIPSFVRRWRASTLTERAAAQSHFTELCHVLGQPSPTEADPLGTMYAFEKRVTEVDGTNGWAHDLPDQQILAELLKLNLKRATVVLTQSHIQRAITDPDAVVEAAQESGPVHLSDAG